MGGKKRNGSVDNFEGTEECKSEALLFPWASTQLLQKTFFDLASSTEHNLVQANRKQLYALHAAFQALTGVPFVDGDGDLEELEHERLKSMHGNTDSRDSTEKLQKRGKTKVKTKGAKDKAKDKDKDTPTSSPAPASAMRELDETTKKERQVSSK